MYLSTLFLSEIENGVEHAITKCNEAFMVRFAPIHDFLSSRMADSTEKLSQFVDQCDEMMALWDVFQEFEAEFRMNHPIINAMKSIRAARGET